MSMGTKALDAAIIAVLNDWEEMETHLYDALDIAPVGSDANEWGNLLAVKFLIRDEIHRMQQLMTTHDRATCIYCREEQELIDANAQSWKRRLLWEATL